MENRWRSAVYNSQSYWNLMQIGNDMRRDSNYIVAQSEEGGPLIRKPLCTAFNTCWWKVSTCEWKSDERNIMHLWDDRLGLFINLVEEMRTWFECWRWHLRIRVRHICSSSRQLSEVCASAVNCVETCFDMDRVDQLLGDTAGVHFIFQEGRAPVAIFRLKLDQVRIDFPRFGLSPTWNLKTLKWKVFLKMLRQYQLHGGIRRLQLRFGQSKRFGTTTTMAASAAPTPWNRLPPLSTILDGGTILFWIFPALLRMTKCPRSIGKFFRKSHTMVKCTRF